MRKRRGRKRKLGARFPSGDLRRQAETPRQVAAGMPHRKALGEQAADQRAETELGRLVLRGALDETLGLAGETYLALWRGYVFSLAGPSELTQAGGHGFTCDGCESEEQRRFCRCSFRKRIYIEARDKLHEQGAWVRAVVEATVLHGYPPGISLPVLRTGLAVLAWHFGLTRRPAVVLGNAASDTAPPPAH